MRRLSYSIIFFLFTIASGCKKVHYFEDKYVEISDSIHLIAHRGGGICNYLPNTINSVRFGLQNYDGVEVDVQISKEGTVWLGHESYLPGCGSISTNCIRETTDKEIEKLDSCIGPVDDFSKLEEVFKLISDSFPEKYISIDTKAWKTCDYINNLDVFGELNVVADGVIHLKNKYNLKHVMIESETSSILRYVKNNSDGIDVYLTAFGDFERGMGIALKKGCDGLSFQYKFKEEITADHIKLLHRKGLKIQIWTVNDPAQQLEAIGIKPDVIQTDNVFSKEIQNYKAGGMK